MRFGKPIPYAKESLEYLIKCEIPFLILSNTGEKTSEEMLQKLEATLDIKIAPCHVLTSRDCMCDALRGKNFTSVKFLSRRDLSLPVDFPFQERFECIPPREDETQTAIALFSDGFLENYIETIQYVALYLIQGATLYCTSSDLTISNCINGVEIDEAGPGLIIHNLRQLLRNKHPNVLKNICILGKGGTQNDLVEQAFRMLKIQGFEGDFNSISFVGDRYDTDIRSGCIFGAKTVLVETGCHKSSNQHEFPEDIADYVASSLSEIIKCHENGNSHEEKKKIGLLFKQLTRFILRHSYSANKLIEKLLKDVDCLFSQPPRIQSCGNLSEYEKSY